LSFAEREVVLITTDRRINCGIAEGLSHGVSSKKFEGRTSLSAPKLFRM
jgi:hypothetical protein